jgi:3-hydroxyisobutyrate dehydrogenase-like beta-hydroxyacid dehydrogenase
MRSLLLTLALVAALLAACGSQSPAADLADKARPAGSWLGTLRFAGEQWMGNRVPEAFVTDTFKEAAKDLDGVADAAKGSRAPAPLRSTLHGLMAEGKAAGGALERAAQGGDRAGVAAQVARIAALELRFAAWQRQAAPEDKPK